MQNDNIVFDEGLVAYDINGKATITINPTDADFFRQIYNTFNDLAKKQDEMDQERQKTKGEEVFEYMHKIGIEMREIIDGLFAAVCDKPSLCDALFSGMNLYSLAGGLPVWCNFLLAVMEKADASIAVQQQLTKPAIQKYTAKYHR